MLKFTPFFIVSIFAFSSVFSQITPPDLDALEGVIVEKYYVAGEGDSDVDLPVGATTWRVFADLKPGYKVQFGIGLLEHPLVFDAGDGVFFNSSSGVKFGSDFLPLLLNFGNVPLDSYLALRGGTTGHAAVPKSMDSDGSLYSGANGFITNNDPTAGIPLLESDGFIPSTAPSISEISGNNDQLGPYFGIANSPNGLFTGSNTSWGILSLAEGVLDENILYLGQFTTTTCQFSFQINITVIVPADLVMDNKNVIVFTATTDPSDEMLSNLPGQGGLPGESDPRYFVQKDFLNYASTIDCSVSVNDKELPENSWTLMPNPTKGQFKIRVNEDFRDLSYSIYSVDGKVLEKIRIGAADSQSTLEIDASNLSNGIYFVELNSAGFSSTKRLIVNH